MKRTYNPAKVKKSNEKRTYNKPVKVVNVLKEELKPKKKKKKKED